MLDDFLVGLGEDEKLFSRNFLLMIFFVALFFLFINLFKF